MANIPMDFWNKKIKDFIGDKNLLNLYNEIVNDIENFINCGQSFILKGAHGTGKTHLSSLVLKKIVEKGYEGLYITLSDIVEATIHAGFEEKLSIARELKMVDFLIIDEFDSRFFASDSSAELFGKILETVIRTRFQNKIPTFLITNKINPAKTLGDELGVSIDSLISGYCKEVFVTGQDLRKLGK